MPFQPPAELIISLVKDDLVNSKLVNSLSAAGLNASDYHLHLSDTILQLMGFSNDPYRDEVFALYLQLSKKVQHINIAESSTALAELSMEIYYLIKVMSLQIVSEDRKSERRESPEELFL